MLYRRDQTAFLHAGQLIDEMSIPTISYLIHFQLLINLKGCRCSGPTLVAPEFASQNIAEIVPILATFLANGRITFSVYTELHPADSLADRKTCSVVACTVSLFNQLTGSSRRRL